MKRKRFEGRKSVNHSKECIKRFVFFGIVFLLIVLILFLVSKFAIRDFREFLGFEFGFGGKEGRMERSEVEGERVVMAPGDVVETNQFNYTWKPLKIGAGGWLTGLDIVSDGTKVVRADTYGAYIWNSTTSQWDQLVTSKLIPLDDQFLDYANETGVYEIRIAESNHNKMYMVWRGYVYRTDNNGATWIRTNFPSTTELKPNGDTRMSGQKMAIDPNNADVVYIGTISKGVWRSFDAGATWTHIPEIPNGTDPGHAGIVFDEGSGVDTNGRTNVVYVPSYGNGVWSSSDAGVTWNSILGGPVRIWHAQIAIDGIYYAADKTSIWKYNGTWTNLTTSAWEIAITDPANASRIIAGADGEDGYKMKESLDRGATWSQPWYQKYPPPGNTIIATDIPWLAWTKEDFMSAGDMQIDPSDGKLYFAEGIGVWKTQFPTTFVAFNWTSQSKGIEQLVANWIWNTGENTFVVSWDRPIFRITNPDVFPSTHGPNRDNALVYGTSVENAVNNSDFLVLDASWYNEQSSFSNDGGVTWKNFSSYPYPQPPLWNTTGGGHIAVSTEKNWVWAMNAQKPGYYTKDGGATWIPLPSPINGSLDWSLRWFNRHIVTADRVVLNKFYLYDYTNGLYVSVDGGDSWTRVYGDIASIWDSYHSLLKAVPGKAGHLFYTNGHSGSSDHNFPSSGEYFMRSTDGGSTWTKVKWGPGANDNVLEVYSFGFGKEKPGSDYPTIFIAGFVNNTWGIWRSDDNASTWIKIGDRPLNSLDIIKTIEGDKDTYGKVYVGFHGSGYAYGVISAGGSCPSGYASNVSQYNITWYFDKCYKVGNFVNGDWWVVGPVNVTSVTPAWDGQKHGSMIDPVAWHGKQGYDARSSWYGFDDNLRIKFPLVIGGSYPMSLVSSVGLDSCVSGGAHECLESAAVLTIVPQIVQSSSFRPAYVSGNKFIYNLSQVDFDIVPKFPYPTDPDAINNFQSLLNDERLGKRVWLDHGPFGQVGGVIRPNKNMISYPGYHAITYVSPLSLMLMIDSSERNNLIIRMIQAGIDLYDISLNNTEGWISMGGFSLGRKWPILFAGIALNHTGMKSPQYYVPARKDWKFSEDGMTFYGQPTLDYPGGKPLYGRNCTNFGVYCGWYECDVVQNRSDCGAEPSGDKDCRDLNGIKDGCGYLEMNAPGWIGQALAAHLMNATSLWNHPPYFDYVDRWVNSPDMWPSWGNPIVWGRGGYFVNAMWDAYRNLSVSGDLESPLIALNSPTNGITLNTKEIEFNYNISDDSLISNCTLFVGSETRINDTIENNAVNNFELDSLENKEYYWNISCVDSYGNIGESETWKLVVNYQPPADGGTTGGNGGGDGGISPKPVAKPINMTNESVEITDIENKIVLGEELSFIDIKEGEEVVIIDLYGNSYKISFALGEDGKVLARVLNGDYIIPKNDILPISLGREELYVGIVTSNIDGAKVVMGLNKEKVIGEIGKEGKIEEEEIIETRISGWYVVFGVLVLVIIVGIVIWWVVGRRGRRIKEEIGRFK